MSYTGNKFQEEFLGHSGRLGEKLGDLIDDCGQQPFIDAMAGVDWGSDFLDNLYNAEDNAAPTLATLKIFLAETKGEREDDERWQALNELVENFKFRNPDIDGDDDFVDVGNADGEDPAAESESGLGSGADDLGDADQGPTPYVMPDDPPEEAPDISHLDQTEIAAHINAVVAANDDLKMPEMLDAAGITYRPHNAHVVKGSKTYTYAQLVAIAKFIKIEVEDLLKVGEPDAGATVDVELPTVAWDDEETTVTVDGTMFAFNEIGPHVWSRLVELSPGGTDRAAIAEQTGLAMSTLYSIERGTTYIDEARLGQLARVPDVAPELLLVGLVELDMDADPASLPADETAGEADETAGEADETAGEADETAGEADETAGPGRLFKPLQPGDVDAPMARTGINPADVAPEDREPGATDGELAGGDPNAYGLDLDGAKEDDLAGNLTGEGYDGPTVTDGGEIPSLGTLQLENTARQALLQIIQGHGADQLNGHAVKALGVAHVGGDPVCFRKLLVAEADAGGYWTGVVGNAQGLNELSTLLFQTLFGCDWETFKARVDSINPPAEAGTVGAVDSLAAE